MIDPGRHARFVPLLHVARLLGRALLPEKSVKGLPVWSTSLLQRAGGDSRWAEGSQDSLLLQVLLSRCFPLISACRESSQSFKL
jgi:hypothetical protein